LKNLDKLDPLLNKYKTPTAMVVKATLSSEPLPPVVLWSDFYQTLKEPLLPILNNFLPTPPPPPEKKKKEQNPLGSFYDVWCCAGRLLLGQAARLKFLTPPEKRGVLVFQFPQSASTLPLTLTPSVERCWGQTRL
jgi:hypothetical protein